MFVSSSSLQMIMCSPGQTTGNQPSVQVVSACIKKKIKREEHNESNVT